ncbi:hypothetical protein [Thiocystis violascens]|uniref:Uncharacterized protein n=1 Tax=Thiocystis violascens (strain ATCC 17096 / DSM 198 / 6111) TaxID=765911 RepID=I3YEI4_THIV6|nr:hypothetical protein [Thiocystis violascens]AFL75402.1 hypothetical protein Thivi_3535 [Thiocystis violascens DSM 198]
MARQTTVRIIRATRAALDAQAGASGLLAGEPYLIEDEGRIAVGTAAGAYSAAATAAQGAKADAAAQPTVDNAFSALQTFTAGIAGGSNIIADAGESQTIPLDGRVHVLTLTRPCAITSMPIGSGYSFALIELIQDGTGGYDVTWVDSPRPMSTQSVNTAPTKVSRFVLDTPNGGTAYRLTGAGADE